MRKRTDAAARRPAMSVGCVENPANTCHVSVAIEDATSRRPRVVNRAHSVADGITREERATAAFHAVEKPVGFVIWRKRAVEAPKLIAEKFDERLPGGVARGHFDDKPLTAFAATAVVSDGAALLDALLARIGVVLSVVIEVIL